jgi:transcriptional regulator with XRE-family HTH domain
MSPVNVSTIGAYIREQREQAKISLRQLAQAAGVSNPYLSQIERGLRRPSADILQQIAKGLRISAEALYVEAGFLEDRPAGPAVPDAVLADPELTERQKQMLIEIYESFRKETAMAAAQAAAAAAEEETGPVIDEAAFSWPENPEPGALAEEPETMDAGTRAPAEDDAGSLAAEPGGDFPYPGFPEPAGDGGYLGATESAGGEGAGLPAEPQAHDGTDHPFPSSSGAR